MSTTLLPAIRTKVGDWITYVTAMSFEKVKQLIKAPDEIHERKALADWIQREVIDTHAKAISEYILHTPQRFLGSLIIGVYDGEPNWAPLNVKLTNNPLEINEVQYESIEGKLGLLHLSGEEKLFAIDGQHRVAGIKMALSTSQPDQRLLSDEVSVIFVAHDETTLSGKIRTRRLFTTLNKKAKPVSKTATIALDEDNGFAIATRQLIDTYWLFEDDRKHISYSSTGSIPAKDEKTITSVVGLYELTKDLYYKDNKKEFETFRPTEDDLTEYVKFLIDFFEELSSQCHAFNEVFVKGLNSARYYRESVNHILFRPIGQRAFAKATQLLLKRGFTLHDAIGSILKAELIITSKDWHNILWDPISETMITNKVSLAETQLLSLSGNDARTKGNRKNLETLLQSRD